MYHLRLAELRNKRNFSQLDMAEYLNISRQAYSSYETGARQIPLDTLCKLADYFEVSTDYLLGRQEALPSFLSDEERGLIEKFRETDERGKETVKNCLIFEHCISTVTLTHRTIQK